MASLKKCISDKCKECTYDPAAPGTWREQVENCTVKRCALWPVRPLTSATISANRKTRVPSINLDAIIGDLEDEDDEVPENA